MQSLIEIIIIIATTPTTTVCAPVWRNMKRMKWEWTRDMNCLRRTCSAGAFSWGTTSCSIDKGEGERERALLYDVCTADLMLLLFFHLLCTSGTDCLREHQLIMFICSLFPSVHCLTLHFINMVTDFIFIWVRMCPFLLPLSTARLAYCLLRLVLN